MATVLSRREGIMKSCKQRYADGGVVAKETPEQLMARMAAKYGVGSSSSQESPPAPKPAAVPQATGQSVSIGKTIDAISSRNNELRKAANYANGGVVQKIAEFRGKGGPKDDKIPVKVAGNEINVSNGEKAVILPAATAKNPLAIAQIEDIIQATNGAPPNRVLKDGGMYMRGLLEPDPANGFDPQTHKGVQPLLPGHVPGTETPLGGENPLKSIAAVLPQESPLRNVIEKQPSSIPQTTAPMNRAGAPGSPLSTVKPGEGVTSTGAPAAADFSSNPTAPAAPDLKVSDTSQSGISKVTGAGMKSPLYTNVSDPAAAVDGLKAAEANTVNMKAGNEALARENALRQEIIDKQQPGAMIAIADQGRAETQALMDKWGREQATQALSRMNPRDSGAVAHLMAADRHAETAANGQALAANTAMRGQDITANTAMADQQNRMKMERERVAGNPLDQETKRLGNESQQRIAKLQQAIIDPATDDATRAIASRNLLALNGKTEPAPYRAIQVGGGTNAMGEKEAADVAVVNERTGEVSRTGKGQPPQAIPAANEREIGKVYDTPRGKMVWRGNGWEMVK
jgi:hypothetical protein